MGKTTDVVTNANPVRVIVTGTFNVLDTILLTST
jgi:hypothetical protein